METANQIPKKITRRALIFSIIVAFVFILMGHQPLGKGLVLGTIFSVLNFILMAKSIGLKFGRSKRQIFSISLASIFLRYIFLAIPVIVAVKFEQFNLVATVVGIFMIQLVILTDHLHTLIPSAGSKQI